MKHTFHNRRGLSVITDGASLSVDVDLGGLVGIDYLNVDDFEADTEMVVTIDPEQAERGLQSAKLLSILTGMPTKIERFEVRA